MNPSLCRADASTHVRIVTTSLLAALLVINVFFARYAALRRGGVAFLARRWSFVKPQQNYKRSYAMSFPQPQSQSDQSDWTLLWLTMMGIVAVSTLAVVC